MTASTRNHRFVSILALAIMLGFLIGCRVLDLGSDIGDMTGTPTPSTGNANVRFKITLDDHGDIQPAVRAAMAGVTVTFRLTTVNPGDPTNPTTVVEKQVAVSDGGSADTSFLNLANATIIGDIKVTGGHISGKTDFHGAVDLLSGDNVLEVSPKGSGLRPDLIAHTIRNLIAAPSLLGAAPRNIVSAIETTGVSLLTARTAPAYDDLFDALVTQRILPSTPDAVKLLRSVDGTTLSGTPGTGVGTWSTTVTTLLTGTGFLSPELATLDRIIRQGFGTTALVGIQRSDRLQGALVSLSSQTGQRVNSLVNRGAIPHAIPTGDSGWLVGGTLDGKPVLARWDGNTNAQLEPTTLTGANSAGCRWVQRFDDLSRNTASAPLAGVEFIGYDPVTGRSPVIDCLVRDPSSLMPKWYRIDPTSGVASAEFLLNVLGIWATPGDGKVTTAWDALANVSSWTLCWATSADALTTTPTQITAATSPYAHTGLINGTTYYYQVKWTEGATVKTSGVVRATPIPATAIASSTTDDLISGVVQLPSGTSLKLDELTVWTNNASSPVAADGTFRASISRLATSSASTIVLIVNRSEKPVFLKLYRRDLERTVEPVNASSTAEALVLYEQEFLYYKAEVYASMQARLGQLAEFKTLSGEVENLIRSDAVSPLDLDLHPNLLTLAAAAGQAITPGPDVLKNRLAPSVRVPGTYDDWVGIEDDSEHVLPIVNIFNRSFLFYDVKAKKTVNGVETTISSENGKPFFRAPRLSPFGFTIDWNLLDVSRKELMPITAGDAYLTFDLESQPRLSMMHALLNAFSVYLGAKTSAAEADTALQLAIAGSSSIITLIGELAASNCTDLATTRAAVKKAFSTESNRAVVKSFIQQWGTKKFLSSSNAKWVEWALSFCCQKVLAAKDFAGNIYDMTCVLYDWKFGPASFTVTGWQRNGLFPSTPPAASVVVAQQDANLLLPLKDASHQYVVPQYTEDGFEAGRPVLFNASPSMPGLEWTYGPGISPTVEQTYTWSALGSYQVIASQAGIPGGTKFWKTFNVVPYTTLDVRIRKGTPGWYSYSRTFNVTIYRLGKKMFTAECYDQSGTTNWSWATNYTYPLLRVPVQDCTYEVNWSFSDGTSGVATGPLPLLDDGATYPPAAGFKTQQLYLTVGI